MKFRFLLFMSMLLLSPNLRANEMSMEMAAALRDGSVAGLYKAVLKHDATKFYQFADVTLRTTSTGSGTLKISANVKVYFGDRTSSEFLSYEYDDCPLNLLTRQITIKNEKNNVSFVGFLKTGVLAGDWHSTVVGRVGKFEASKDTEPTPPTDGILVKTLTGFYKGELVNTNPESNLPERATMSLVTTQDSTGPEPVIKISGNVRLYLGEFGSLEYVETKLTDVQFNFYNRYLTARTADYGLTFKGVVSPAGVFTGVVFADGLGEVANATLRRPDASLVDTISGVYKGTLSNTHPTAVIPERVSLTLISGQPGSGAGINLTGSLRLYYGAFGSSEYVETKLSEAQLNSESRQLSVRTIEHGLVFKGTVSLDGVFKGEVFAEGFGEVGKANLVRNR